MLQISDDTCTSILGSSRISFSSLWLSAWTSIPSRDLVMAFALPPSTGCFSTRCTSWPRSANAFAARIPAIPPPTTNAPSKTGLVFSESGLACLTCSIAIATSSKAFSVTESSSKCTHAHCSRMFATSKSPFPIPISESLSPRINVTSLGEHAATTNFLMTSF